MIKKILGVLSSLGVLALIVFIALGAGSYKSMLPAEWFSWMQTQPVVKVEAPKPMEQSEDVVEGVDAAASTDDRATDDGEVLKTE